MAQDEKATLVCGCGSELFWESFRVNGWWRTLIDGDGTVNDTDLSQLKYGARSRTVVCTECGKRLPNPNRNQGD